MGSRNVLAIEAINPALNAVSRAIDTYGGSYLTIYLKSSAGTTAGAGQLEGSPTGSLSAEPSQADWVAIGSALAFGAANTTVKATASEAHRFVRVRVSTAL